MWIASLSERDRCLQISSYLVVTKCKKRTLKYNGKLIVSSSVEYRSVSYDIDTNVDTAV